MLHGNWTNMKKKKRRNACRCHIRIHLITRKAIYLILFFLDRGNLAIDV